MDSESYLEVRDTSVAMVCGRTLRGLGVLTTSPLLAWGSQYAGTVEQSLIPVWQRRLLPNSLPTLAGQGRSCAWPQGPLASPCATRDPPKPQCWGLQGGTVRGGG